MSFGKVTTEYLEEIGTEIRKLGYPQYSNEQKFSIAETENCIRLKDIIQDIGQLNLANSVAQEKLALEDIPMRCFVTEKSSIQTQENISLSNNGAILIHAIYLSESMVMVGWLESPTRALYVRILAKEDDVWVAKPIKQIAVNDVQEFDLLLILPNVVIIGYTLGQSQGFQRLDINNGRIRDHGSPTILPSHEHARYTHIKLWLVENHSQVEFGYFLWGHDDREYGRSFSTSLKLVPYDADPEGTTQKMESRDKPLHVQRGPYGLDYISYTANTPYALCVYQLTPTEIYIVRIGANNNVITEIGRLISGLWWVVPAESAQGGVNGSSTVTAVIASPSKAVVCYNGQNAVWGVVDPLRSNHRPEQQKLLDGNFTRLKLIKLTEDTYCLAAYGEGSTSDQSTILKFKVDINTNQFSIIYSYKHSGFGSADMVFMNNIDMIICANQYNSQIQTSKLVAQPQKLNLGVTIAKEGDPIAGVSSRTALEGDYVSVEMIKPES